MILDNTQKIIEKLKQIKAEKDYTLQDIVDMTGVPKSTVARVFGNKQANFKYETLQPIIRALLGFDDAEVDAEPLPSEDMITLYQSIVEAKNREIDQVVKELEEVRADSSRKVEFLKKDNATKDSIITDLQRSYKIYRIVMFVLMAFICILFGVDAFAGTVGWFRW